MKGKKMKLATTVILGITTVCVGFCLCGIHVVDTGYRGIKTHFGKVVGEPLREGIYFYNPLTTSIHDIDIQVQKYSMRMNAYTKDVQQADLDVSINTRLDESKVHLLYQEIGSDYKNKIIAPQILKAVKNTIGIWEADSLVSNREKAGDDIQQALKEGLEPYHILVQNIVIEDINYSSQFEKAIEEKQIATQEAIKAKNRTKQIEEEAQQKVLTAKAEAESMKIRSQALSQNQNLVAYEAVQKWDGKLPSSLYGNAPIPFLQSAIQQ